MSIMLHCLNPKSQVDIRISTGTGWLSHIHLPTNMIFSNLLLASLAAAAPHTVELSYETSYYVTHLEVGTPPQKIRAAFDTGSPFIWTRSTNTTECVETHKCLPGDLWNVSSSQTWKYQKEGANWGGHGMWGSDSVTFAGYEATGMEVYVAKDKIYGDHPQVPGIFGQSANKDGKKSFVQRLAEDGQISRALFTVHTDDQIFPRVYGTKAKAVFGGFDAAKYEGNLTTISHPKSYSGVGIQIRGFSVNGKSVESDVKHTVVLDTGGVIFALPHNVIKAVSENFGGGLEGQKDYWYKCGEKPVVTFQFGYTDIDVKLYEGNFSEEKNGKCYFKNITYKDKGATLLEGAPLISRAMVIYDHDRQQVHIAKAKYTYESNIVEMTGDVPGAVEWVPEN